MTMIVREMIVLDQECFQPSNPNEFSDDSGWLGPPRAVPFAWELAPGTPKQERASHSSTSNSCEEQQLVDSSSSDDITGSERHSIHILETAPEMFLVARNSEVAGELVFNQESGAVPFKWEMEPGIPRDPDKCRQILDCPLTPPPVLHSRSMVVHSGKSGGSSSSSGRTGRVSLSQRMRSLLWVHPQKPKQQDFLMRAGPAANHQQKMKKSQLLLLQDSTSENGKGTTSKKEDHRSDEEELSPVSVLEYNNSLRLSSASSSVRSYYHTPKDSFSWGDSSPASPSLSSNRSFKSAMSREASLKKKNSLYSLLTLKKKVVFNSKKDEAGCLMMLTTTPSSNRSSSFTYDEVNMNDFNSSSSSSSSSSSGKESSSESVASTDSTSPTSQPEVDSVHSKECTKVVNGEAEVLSDEETRSVYFSPAAKFGSESFSFHPVQDEKQTGESLEFKGFDTIERVDSLETIDPGFAPSEIGDESYQQMTILNRMTSCARWQKKQASGKASHLARSLLGRVAVCCYVAPARREDD